MSQTLPIVLVASLLAGGAGALATTLLAPNAPAPIDVSSAGSEIDLASEIRALSDQNRDLSERLSALEVSKELAPVGGAGRLSVASPTNLEDAVREVLASMSAEGVTPPPADLAKAVENVIELREERDRLEREQQRAEQAAKRLEDRLAKLQTDLGLDQSQVNAMREVFQAEDASRRSRGEEMQKMREAGTPWEDMRALITAARDEQKVVIQGILTPSQYETYEASEQNDRGGFGGRARGGNGGGGNAGGGRRGN